MPRAHSTLTHLLTALLLSTSPTHAAPAPTITPPRLLVAAPATLPPLTPPADRTVILELVLGLDGTVTSATVTTSAGSPWDEAAVAAARQSRFSPALADGLPISVKVPFTFRFRRPARRPAELVPGPARRPLEPAPGRVFAATLIERGTRTPQGGLPVLLSDSRTGLTWEALSDADGHVLLHGLPATQLKLSIFTPGFEPFDATVTATAQDDAQARAAAKRFALAPTDAQAFRTEVREPRPPDAASVITLRAEELTQVAGTLGDPTRVTASLPGVARSPFGLGYYVVRGAEFDNTGFFIDGHPAIFLYHLLGGPGVIHPELVGGLSFYPGGYPANFGRVASSVIAIETQDPPRDRWHLDLEVDVFKAGLLASLPFDDGRGVATVALRRSYYDLILPAFTDQIDLAYTDYQARVSYAFSPTIRGRFVALGAVDSLAIQDTSSESESTSSTNTSISMGFHRLNLAFDFDLSRDLTLTTSALWEYDTTNNRRVAPGDDPINADISGWAGQLITVLKARLAPAQKLDFGLDLLFLDVTADLAVPAGTPLGLPRPPAFSPKITQATLRSPYLGLAPFLSGDFDLGAGLRLLPGLRLNVDHYRDRWVPTLDPRLAVRWTLHPAWTLKAMAALTHQPPQVFQVGRPWGDPSIPPVQGFQTSLGAEWLPAPGWLVSLEGFYQHLDHLVRPNDQLTEDNGELTRRLFTPDMQGKAYGIELMIRREFSDIAYGWLSYTLSRAERLRPPDGWTAYELDQTHILNLAWTFRLGAGWSLGARFQLASGNLALPITDAAYDADSDRYLPVYGTHARRLPTYHRLDIRLDKTWRFETWILQAFLDVQNVYNAQNPEIPRYSFDYRVKADGISLPILPSLGFRMVF